MFLYTKSQNINGDKMVTVRVKEKTYKELNVLAGKLQTRFKKPVSVDEAINYLVKKSKLRASNFAGAWSMTDEERDEILKSLKKMWSSWKYQKG